ncbi:MAG: hypothetical protein PUG67_05090 [Peptoniphilaceae bacterium]|nr:hypothetical protein [Peptoniphilaceae bacterium]MDY6018929.1 hypothetical protein [Anaerococcus sp.]
MAVEKMRLVNIMGRLKYIDDFLEDVIKIDELDQVGALTEIQNRDFSIKATEENIDRIEDFNDIESFLDNDQEIIDKLEDIKENFAIADKKEGHRISTDEIDKMYSKLSDLIAKKKELEEQKEELETYVKNYEILNRESIDIDKIQKLKYFSYRFGEISKEGRFILKNNYENIPSTIIHLNNSEIAANAYKEYIDEIISIDESTVELREQTDKILANEKENVNNVSVHMEKEFYKSTKDRAQELYDSIISEVDQEVKDIENQYKDESKKTKEIFDANKDKLVKKFLRKITK